MKKTTKFWLCPFIAMGLVLVFNNSCKKDDLKIDPEITWANPVEITSETPLSVKQLNAKANVSGTFVYSPAIGTKLNVGANQNLKVDFTPTDFINFNTASKTVIINVIAPITVTDIDGNVYKTVKIATQLWTAENLKTTKYRNGDPIPNISSASEWSKLSTGAYCNYDNTSGNSAIYGKLYNWYAVADSRKIAPTGWHVATDAEWITLEDYVFGNSGPSSSVAKALASATYWATSTKSGAIGNDLTTNNFTGFSALPGGGRSITGEINQSGMDGVWWSSYEFNSDLAAGRMLYCHNYYLFAGLSNKKCGFSVRLVRD